MDFCASFALRRILNRTTMKFERFSLFVCLLFVSGASAQVADTVAQRYRGVLYLKPKTEAELFTEKVMKLKITHQNLVDVNKAATPEVKLFGAENNGKEIFVLLNGVQVTYKEFKTIDPKDISKITLIKDNRGFKEDSITKNYPALKEFFTNKYSQAIVVETKKKATPAK